MGKTHGDFHGFLYYRVDELIHSDTMWYLTFYRWGLVAIIYPSRSGMILLGVNQMNSNDGSRYVYRYLHHAKFGEDEHPSQMSSIHHSQMSSIQDTSKPCWLMIQWVLCGYITLWLFNIAMENGPFIDGLPFRHGWIFHGYVSHNQMVS